LQNLTGIDHVLHVDSPMDILGLLRQEDDNPRGQQGGRFISGSNLEEAAAAEARREEIRSQRWPIGRQEAGILHIVTAKNFFQRMRVAEPRLGRDGETIWTVRAGVPCATVNGMGVGAQWGNYP
jgi:hypothetical protein